MILIFLHEIKSGEALVLIDVSSYHSYVLD